MKKQDILNAFREKFQEQEVGCTGTCDHIFSNGEQINITDMSNWLLTTLTEFERDLIKEIDKKNFEYMEECEIDCNAVRHAKHEGSWQHFWKMDLFLDELEKEKRT